MHGLMLCVLATHTRTQFLLNYPFLLQSYSRFGLIPPKQSFGMIAACFLRAASACPPVRDLRDVVLVQSLAGHF